MLGKFPYRYRVLILLFFLILVTYLDRVCIALVGVRIKTEFGLSNSQFGWVLGAFALAYALFEIPSGVLGDKIGQRKVLLRIVLWWSLFTALTGVATGFAMLICFRFLFGMGEAGAYPNSSAVVSRWLPATETSRGISSLFVGQYVGATIAPLIVIPIATAMGWRATFFINGFIGIIWVMICYSWFHNEPVEMKNISITEVNLIQQSRRYMFHQSKIPWKHIVADINIRRIMISFFCANWALYFFVAWMPVYLQQGRHFSENAMKTTVSLIFIVGIFGALTSGILGDWLTKRFNIAFSRRFIGMMALGMTGVSFIVAASVSSVTIAAYSLVAGSLFFSFFGNAAFSTCVDIGGNHAGTVAGIMNFSGQIGSFFLSISFGKLVDTTHNFNFPLYIIASFLLTGAFIWLSVDPKKQVVILAQNTDLLPA